VKVAGRVWPLGGVEEDAVLKCLGGFVAAGAGGLGIAVTGPVAAEVALPRSDLVQAARVEVVDAYQRMGF